jgi:hypothetical protein
MGASKIVLQLNEIHNPLPDYKEKMQFSMDRYFAKMSTNAPLQRGSWSFELHQPLYMSPEEQHPSIQSLTDEKAEDQIHF